MAAGIGVDGEHRIASAESSSTTSSARGIAESCLKCQSSDSAKLSVKPEADYKLVCQSMGQQEWPAVYIPGQTQTTTSIAPTDSSLPTNGSDSSNSGSSHSGLSSGAVAGIIVSAIALIVALAVAGYVFARRRRDLAKRREDEELYKFQGATRNSYIETPVPQYTGMIEPSLPPLPQITNLRVMNPDNDDNYLDRQNSESTKYSNTLSHATKGSSPGWRRGSFDDD
ncbi:hypothetical protein BG011_008645 [Mortierella polycephala]|uniref:Uncharacterized protein n=1 Tax=Mortierella polycephala TaxID=41804 RepID=A0A9P6TXF1_9FUNG|nr:hypothetical protein BG011_008645 [Mortierella polycephala]